MFLPYRIRKSLKRSLKAASMGNAESAFALLEPVFKSSELYEKEKIWKMTWKTVGDIFQHLEEPQLATASNEVVVNQASASPYFNFGYGLVEKGLYDPAVSVLKKGVALFPHDEKVLTELVHVYEQKGAYQEAQLVLLSARDLVETSFFSRYLAIFNSIMCRDLDKANELFEGLLSLLCSAELDLIENYTLMFETVKGMLTRGKWLVSHTPLDDQDLRGWNGVINGNVVMSLSDFGVETMKGRYGWFQEGAETLFSCIAKLKETLDALGFKPERLLAFPDRDSTILAHAAAQTFGCDVEVYSQETRNLPGLIVGYSSDLITEELFELLWEAHEGQVFWCHASNWTHSSVAPDFISYFAEATSPPWNEKLKVSNMDDVLRGEEPKVDTVPALEGSIKEILESLQAMVDAPIEEDAEEVKSMAKVLFSETSDFGKAKKRSRQWADSPV